MIKTFENFDRFDSRENITGIVGVPSGEYIEVDEERLKNLVFSNLLIYDMDLKCLTFKDSDYYKITNQSSDKKYNDVKKFLNLIGLNNYKINDDLSVDAIGNVKIRVPLYCLPVKFDYVMGHFDISNCGLESLQGCPDTVEGDFLCSGNNLDDLVNGPKVVNGNYDVRDSGLKSLAGAPMRIKKNFSCSKNGLNNLVGGPRIVDGSYYADNCLLTSLKGTPDLLTGHFDCSYNLLETLEDGPDLMSGTYDCSNNNLKTLKWGPGSVGVFKCNGNKNLRDLSDAPYASKIISDEI